MIVILNTSHDQSFTECIHAGAGNSYDAGEHIIHKQRF